MKYSKPPIIEAVLDIDCDMSATFDVASLEAAAHEAYGDAYPQKRQVFIQAFHVEAKPDEATSKMDPRSILGYQFLQADQKQLVQVRTTGFSFNRLAPYDSFDAYLPEIKRTWELFRGLAKPLEIQQIRLRYINLIKLPLKSDGSVQTDDYFTMNLSVPDEGNLQLISFVVHQTAVELATKNVVNFRLMPQPMVEEHWPIIVDTEVVSPGPLAVDDWTEIERRIGTLRNAKNRVFESALTDRCKELFT